MTIKEAFDTGNEGRFLIVYDAGYDGIEIESRHATLDKAMLAMAQLRASSSEDEFYLLCMVGRT